MMNRKQVRVSRLALGLIVALATAPAMAQQTSAAVGGVVTGTDSQPVTGAEVTILHTPSGTVSRATTDASGRYNARGLRVGGPYTITVTGNGQTDTEQNVSLRLGEVTNIDVQLGAAAEATQLEAIQVVGVGAASVFSPDAMGTGTNISRAQIEALPSIKRDLQDYARLDPRISQTDKERGEISAAGQNTRYNAVTIDRVSTNDTFGLEANNLPTLRQPISIDAIEEVQVNVANYDVTQKGYTGANINAITKSGTNEFDGSVYYLYREADWVGEDEDGNEFTGFDDEETYGATFGGPIVKDTLFFFLNYEKTTITAPSPDFGPIGSGASNIVPIDPADIADAQDIARGYGFDPGELRAPGLETQVESYLGKFDWNINEDHRLSFRFSRTEQDELILPDLDFDDISLSSHWYTQTKEFKNYVAELFSDWTDSFSTEASLSFRDYASVPVNQSRQPQVQVDFGRNQLNFGTEQFRHNNVLETETWSGYFAGNLFVGDHELKFGADYEKNDIFNLFLESNFGTYRFRDSFVDLDGDGEDEFIPGLENFRNGDYSDYALRIAAPGQNPAAEFTLENLGVFFQDTWAVNANLTLTLGVRYDEPMLDDKPAFNQDALDAFGYRNDVTIDGNGLLQPRFGFNYTFDTERQTQLRGGIGLFQGAAANVWISNPFTNNGLTIDVFGCGSGFNDGCDEIVDLPPISSDPDNQNQIGSARADVDILDPDLEQPSIYKANIAIDHELPWWGMVFSTELLWTQVKNGIYYEHLNLGAPTAIGQDGRQLFYGELGTDAFFSDGFNPTSRANANRDFREVLLTKSTNKGDGQNLTVSLTKPMAEEDSWFWQVAYSFNEATDVNPLTSSRAISNWNGRMIFNPNENVASRSNYVVKDRFTAALSYRHYFFENYKTEVSVFYEGRKGKPYSWTYINDMNGDGIGGNDLMYIPSGPGDVSFTTAADEQAFWEFVGQNPELARYQGQVVDRNSAFSPWVNQFDVRILQELPGFFADNKAEIWVDILNFGNLLNDEWGQIEEIGFPLNRSFVNMVGVQDGKYVYDFVRPENFSRRDRTGESRWAVQVGFRYKF